MHLSVYLTFPFILGIPIHTQSPRQNTANLLYLLYDNVTTRGTPVVHRCLGWWIMMSRP
ncbi:Protein of unknown function [Pyronema omphalodes CBS 100304]|uniref:Uncharacterized protein n=1 Tax=Pyronema omphalodes (strain CBS 100304) TaxID=1076935 RepID=U4LR72_PYROM|nr:Protein of unknown function [Pyronema omphalodes CBS 100304]